MQTLIRIFKVLFAVVAAIIVLDMAVATTMSYYDAHTKTLLLHVVARELPPHASMQQMTEFIRRHTERYGLDSYNHEYAGIVAQTSVDKMLVRPQSTGGVEGRRRPNVSGRRRSFFYTAL